MRKKNKVGFFVVLAISITIFIAIAMGFMGVHNYASEYYAKEMRVLQQDVRDREQVIRILQAKRITGESIERGLKMELEKVNKEYKECESYRNIIKNLPPNKEIRWDMIIPLPDVKGGGR